MPQAKSSVVDQFNFVPSLLILCFLCIGFIPNWQAVDKIAPQWLAMSCLNLVTACYLIYRRKVFVDRTAATLKSLISVVYIGFILWASLSYFYAINPTEALVNITRQLNVLLMYLHMGILLYNIKSKAVLISYAIALILFIEIYVVLNQALEMYLNSGFISGGELKGVTANRNITAFSLAIKIPFVLFLIYHSKKTLFKFLLGGFVFATLFGLSMIQSRASFIAAGLILVAFISMNLILFFQDKKQKTHLYRIGYYLLPFFFAIVANQVFISDKGAGVLSRAATISVSTNDGSVNKRLRYYADVLTHLKSNPVFGVGLGNWKLKSIDYDKKDLEGYVVPYHAHSDFIQLGAELGIIGFLLYLAVFLIAGYCCFYLIKQSTLKTPKKVFVFLLLTALGVYTIDANLNFPIARPQVLVVWTLIMGLINYYFIQSSKGLFKRIKNTPLSLIFCSLGVLFMLPAIAVSNNVYKSHKGQMYLLQDFNANKFSVPLDKVDGIVPDIPNITVTTIPLKSVKARYYFHHKEYDKALQLLNEGTTANPFLYYSELLKSQIYTAKGQLDSALVYGREAFINLPNNALHSSNYLQLLSKQNDRAGIEEIFEPLTKNNNLTNWKNFLIISAQVTPPGDSALVAKAKTAMKLFPEDDSFSQLYRSIALGNSKINEALAFSNLGQQLFNEGEYILAAENFERAVQLNPLDYVHRENAATAYYVSNMDEKALPLLNTILSEMNSKSGKSEYLKALILIRKGELDEVCTLLNSAIKFGYQQAEAIHKEHCTE